MLEHKLNTQLNGAEHRTIVIKQSPFDPNKIFLKHCNNLGIESKSEYTFDKMQAKQLAEAILQYCEETSGED